MFQTTLKNIFSNFTISHSHVIKICSQFDYVLCICTLSVVAVHSQTLGSPFKTY